MNDRKAKEKMIAEILESDLSGFPGGELDEKAKDEVAKLLYSLLDEEEDKDESK